MKTHQTSVLYLLDAELSETVWVISQVKGVKGSTRVKTVQSLHSWCLTVGTVRLSSSHQDDLQPRERQNMRFCDLQARVLAMQCTVAALHAKPSDSGEACRYTAGKFTSKHFSMCQYDKHAEGKDISDVTWCNSSMLRRICQHTAIEKVPTWTAKVAMMDCAWTKLELPR